MMETKVGFYNEEVFEKYNKESEEMKKRINDLSDKLKFNPRHGRYIKKKFWPKFMLEMFHNLYVAELTASWRLLYVLAYGENETLVLIYSWMDHKDYVKLFGY